MRIIIYVVDGLVLAAAPLPDSHTRTDLHVLPSSRNVSICPCRPSMLWTPSSGCRSTNTFTVMCAIRPLRRAATSSTFSTPLPPACDLRVSCVALPVLASCCARLRARIASLVTLTRVRSPAAGLLLYFFQNSSNFRTRSWYFSCRWLRPALCPPPRPRAAPPRLHPAADLAVVEGAPQQHRRHHGMPGREGEF